MRVTNFADARQAVSLWHADVNAHRVYECSVDVDPSTGSRLVRQADWAVSYTIPDDTYTTDTEAHEALTQHLAGHDERDRQRREGTRATTTAERQAAYDALREAQAPSAPAIPEGEWDADDLGNALDAAEAAGRFDEPPVVVTQERLREVGHGHVLASDLQGAAAWGQVK
jgi:hypothetical protein